MHLDTTEATDGWRNCKRGNVVTSGNVIAVDLVGKQKASAERVGTRHERKGVSRILRLEGVLAQTIDDFRDSRHIRIRRKLQAYGERRIFSRRVSENGKMWAK